MSKRLLVVFGATGNQGGSVINTILNSPSLSAKYSIRAITRDLTKDSSKALEKRGCELATGDLDNPESLKNALQNADAVFGLTNFWESKDAAKETKQGINLAEAAFAAGVKHIVFSTLHNPTKLTDGKLANINHFISKSRIEDYIEENKAKHGTIASYFWPAVFMSNVKGGMARPNEDGTLGINLPVQPDVRVPFIDAAGDSGKYVVGALEAGKSADGVQMQAVSQWLTMTELAKTLEQVSGKEVKYNQISAEMFKSFLPEETRLDTSENFMLIDEYQYFGKGSDKNQAESDKFLVKDAKLTTFEEYAKTQAPW